MGTVTINTTSAQDARIAPAFGRRLGLVDQDGNPRDATAAEVKAELIDLIRIIVRQHEKQEARRTAEAAVTDIDPT